MASEANDAARRDHLISHEVRGFTRKLARAGRQAARSQRVNNTASTMSTMTMNMTWINA
jgi:hypothetical protein